MKLRHCLAFALSFVALGAACLPSLEDLTPFPCAQDTSCPRGLSCTPGVGCVTASLDSPCVVGATNCAGAGEAASCALGLCTIGCDERRTCPAGHVCSAPAAAGAGVCVPDCAANQACPPGLTCRPLGFETAKGCLGAGGGAALDAPCQREEECSNAGSTVTCSVGVCATPCGPTLPCAAGHLCSSYQNRKAGACLPDCSDGGSCPQGLQCKPIGYEGKSACVGPDDSNVTCSDHLDTDDANCASCGQSCGAFGRCVAGGCVCGEGALKCADTCANPKNDPKNCGACGHDCLQGACLEGQCQPWAVIPELPPSSTGGEVLVLDSVDANKMYLRGVVGSPGAWDAIEAYGAPVSGGVPTKLASFAPKAYPNGYVGSGFASPAGLYMDVFERVDGASHHSVRLAPYTATGAAITLLDVNTSGQDYFLGFGLTGGAVFARGASNVNNALVGSILARVNTKPPYGLFMQPMRFSSPGVAEYQFDGVRFLYVLGFLQDEFRIVRVDATKNELLEGCVGCPVSTWAGSALQSTTSPVTRGPDVPPDLDRLERAMVVDQVGLAFSIGGHLRYLKHGALALAADLVTSGSAVYPLALDGSELYYLVAGASPLYLDRSVWRVPVTGGTPMRIVLMPQASRYPIVGPDSIFYQVGNTVYRVAK